MNLGTCPNCNEDVLLPNESAEFGYYVGATDMTHVACGERVLMVPYVDYNYDYFPFDC